jgi:hypothetical protein
MAFRWTKESAVKELRALAADTERLATLRRYSADHTKWIAKVLAVLEEVFGRESRYFLTFATLSWSQEGQFVIGGIRDPEGSLNPQAAIERRHHEAFLRQLESARGLLLAAAEHLQRRDLETVYEGKNTPPESSSLVRILNIAEHSLRKIIHDKPEKERTIQDAFESLLIGAEMSFSRETDSIEYSSKTYTPDFTMPKIDLAIDIKLCNRDGREKEIIAEINDDIMAYQTKYGNLLFVIYDIGFIRDVERFADSFETQRNVIVRVVKH